MNIFSIRKILPIMALAVACLLTACATDNTIRTANEQYMMGNYESGLDTLKVLLDEDPNDAHIRNVYLSMRERALSQILVRADESRTKGETEKAKAGYLRALGIDRDNSRAAGALDIMSRDARHADLLGKARTDLNNGAVDSAQDRLRQVLTENMGNVEAKNMLREIEHKTEQDNSGQKISKALSNVISIDFKDAMLKQVFEVFARTSTVNFVFDKDVKTDQKTTIFLRDTAVKDAIDIVLLTNQLEQRMLDENTLLIYPNTPAKQKDYQKLSVRGFFIANADPEQVANALKTLLKIQDIIIDKRQSLITVRDTPENIRLAARLVALSDLPEAEVMLEVEILEISRNKLTSLGINYPDQIILAPLAPAITDPTSGSTGSTGSTGLATIPLSDLRNLNSSSISATVPPLVINAKKRTGDVNILANPRIRAKNRETAKILIGDKVPNITSTSTATGFVASSVQYLDVGLKLEITPSVTPDNEISIQIMLEVSNIADRITVGDTVAYQIGTRNASTVLRLKDGENQILAGLISDEDRNSADRVPGLGDLPILGRLFSSHTTDDRKTEILLSITPRLVRASVRPDLSTLEFDTGTKSAGRDSSAGKGAASSASPTSVSTKPKSTGPGGPGSAAPGGGGYGAPGTIGPGGAIGANVLKWSAPTQAKANDPAFELSLELTPGQPFVSTTFTIGYDPNLTEIEKVTAGNLFSQGGPSRFNYTVDKAEGTITVTLRQTGTIDQSLSPGTVAVLSVKPGKKAGPANFNIQYAAGTLQNATEFGVPIPPPPPLTVNITK